MLRKMRLAYSGSLPVLASLAAAGALAVGVSSAAAQTSQPAQPQMIAANSTDTAVATGAIADRNLTIAANSTDAVAATDTTTDQSASASPTTVGEIMVTARLREENIQKVPETIVAVTPQVLQDNNVVNFYNMQGMAPSLDVYTGWIKDYTTIEIRGFPAAAYFNETPTQPYSLYDLSDVQILYGPQGTLFGYTALGGAVLYSAMHPQMNTFGAGLDLTEGNLNETNVQGYVNIPIVQDQLALRISFERDHTDGYTQVQGGYPPLDSNDNESVRFGLQYNAPGGKFTDYFMWQMIHEDDTETAEVVTYYNKYDGLPASANGGVSTLPPAADFSYLCSPAEVTEFWQPGATPQQCAQQRANLYASFAQSALSSIAPARASGDREVEAPIENGAPYDPADNWQLNNVANYDIVQWNGALGGGDVYVHNITKVEWYRNVVSNFTAGADDFYAASGLGDYIPTPNTPLLDPNATTPPSNGLGTPILQAFSMDYQNELQIHGTLDKALGATPGVTWVVGLYASGAPNGPGPTSPNIPISFNGAYNVNEGPYPSYWAKSYWTANWAEYFNATIDAGMFWKPLTGLQVSGGVRQSENYASDYYYTITANYNNPAYPNIYSTSSPLYHDIYKSDPLNWQWSVSYVIDNNNIYVSNAFIVVPGYTNTPLPSTVPASDVPGYVANVEPEDLLYQSL